MGAMDRTRTKLTTAIFILNSRIDSQYITNWMSHFGCRGAFDLHLPRVLTRWLARWKCASQADYNQIDNWPQAISLRHQLMPFPHGFGNTQFFLDVRVPIE